MARTATTPSRLLFPLVFTVLLGWVLFLRWPSLGVPLWNVDESIHAAIARLLGDGGVLYRDASDIRAPLTYWLFAGLFSLFGDNNLFAVRLVLALAIAATAFVLFLLARRTRGTAAGLWAAGIFAALSTNLIPAPDAFAAHTEWAVIAFTTAGAWWFWRSAAAPGFRSGLIGGALFALAFLSKQPAMLDFGAPLAATVWLTASGIWNWRAGARMLGGLLAGSATIVALAALYFVHAGALGEAIFYSWTYNLSFYGPEITAADRVLSGFQPFVSLAHAYPLVFAAVLVAAILLLVRLVQFHPTPVQKDARAWYCYLLVWSAASLAGAASSGRGFGHYAIQCLPVFSLAAALVLGELTVWVADLRAGRILGRLTVGAVLVFTAVCLLWRPLGARSAPPPPVDPAAEASAFIRERTTDTDSLFVWGFNSDIHLYTGRKPASRFVHCTFLTGLIPWTNAAPGIDTAYAIVPGTMDLLLSDLERSRPPFVIDCSPGPHRGFHKYPISAFPRLQALLDRDYAVTEPERFVPQGFRLHVLRDHARRRPLPLAGGPAVAAASAPQLSGRTDPETQPTPYTVACTAPDGRLQRLELLVDGAAVDGVSVAPCRELSITLTAPFNDLPAGPHRLVARATRADGTITTSEELAVVSASNALPADKLAAFRIPAVTRTLAPETVSAPFGPAAQREGDALVFAVHAPSRIVVALEPAVRRASGGFGIRPGAYAADNSAPTDGARFCVLLVAADGTRTMLLERLLRPRDVADDRPVQHFSLALPPHAAGAKLEFTTDPGPANNAACDWTFWSDLAIDCIE